MKSKMYLKQRRLLLSLSKDEQEKMEFRNDRTSWVRISWVYLSELLDYSFYTTVEETQ